MGYGLWIFLRTNLVDQKSYDGMWTVPIWDFVPVFFFIKGVGYIRKVPPDLNEFQSHDKILNGHRWTLLIPFLCILQQPVSLYIASYYACGTSDFQHNRLWFLGKYWYFARLCQCDIYGIFISLIFKARTTQYDPTTTEILIVTLRAGRKTECKKAHDSRMRMMQIRRYPIIVTYQLGTGEDLRSTETQTLRVVQLIAMCSTWRQFQPSVNI